MREIFRWEKPTKLTLAVLAAAFFTFSPEVTKADIIMLNPSESIFVDADGTDSVNGAPSVGVTAFAGETVDFGIRERRNAGQTALRVSSFLNWDLSALTPADVNAAGFSASFQVDYVGQLNNSNRGSAVVGTVVGGTWDASGDNNPSFAWGFDSVGTSGATNPQTLVSNISAATTVINDISVDITSTVQAWVNGTLDQNGLAVYVPSLESQGAVFNDAALVLDIPAPTTSVPEPTSLAVLGMGCLAIAVRRRK